MTRVQTVWLAIRDGGTLTIEQIEARCPEEYSGRRIAPIIAWLVMKGWVAQVGLGLDCRYINARLRRWA